MARFTDDVTFTAAINCAEDAIPPQTRASILKQEDLVPFPIPLTAMRVWDALQTVLPGTPANDDLGLIGTTFGSVGPTVTAGDLKAAGATTRRMRCPQVVVPECYVDGQTLNIDVYAGMATTVADTSCTIDVECYRLDKLGAIGSDICATAAMTMNTLAPLTKKTFAITPTTLAKGDVLDIRITIVCTDAATVTAVTPTIGGVDLVCDIKG